MIFEKIKKIISTNVIIEINLNLQYHLIANINEFAFKECLFQLYNIEFDIKTISKFLSNERIVIFLSFRL